MKYDFEKAVVYSDVLSDPAFATVMNRISWAARETILNDQFGREYLFQQKFIELGGEAKNLALIEEINIQSKVDFCPNPKVTSHINMALFGMKENALVIAFMAGALTPGDLRNIEELANVSLTPRQVEALRGIGMPNLANIAEFYVR